MLHGGEPAPGTGGRPVSGQIPDCASEGAAAIIAAAASAVPTASRTLLDLLVDHIFVSSLVLYARGRRSAIRKRLRRFVPIAAAAQ